MSPRLDGPEVVVDPWSSSAARPPAHGAAPGVELGGLRLLQRVGAGGIADVWSAEPITPGALPARVALKLLREPERSRDHTSRFLREGRLLMRLGLAGLPTCFAVWDEPHPALVLSLLEGETLSARLRREGPLPHGVVTAIADGLLRALAGLHGAGIVHRDVKASNVFLCDDGSVWLIDLGLASDPMDPTHTTVGDVIGTWAYMAPEQLAGAEVDSRADLYSLGVTLHEALTGARPVSARGPAALLRAHRDPPPAPLRALMPDAPPPLIALIDALSARDPVARPSSAVVARALLTGADRPLGALLSPPLIGRAAVIGALEAILDGGGALLLSAEPGAGLPRVLREALRIARDHEVETLRLRCRAEAHPADLLHQLSEGLAALGLPTPAQRPSLEAALRDLAAEAALLLVVEDAELLSPAAVGDLCALIDAAPEMRALLCGARLSPALPGHRVDLRPLRVDEVEQLVAGMLGVRSAPAGLASRLVAQTAGLAALVVDSVHELIQRGQLEPAGAGDDGRPRWRLRPGAGLAPGGRVERVFGRTLVALSPEARSLLDVLAVAGDEVPMDTALALASADRSGIAAQALSAARLASVERHADGEWLVLRRPAVRPLLLEQVSADRQRAVHAALAEALGGPDADPWHHRRAAWHAAQSAPASAAPGALTALGEDLLADGQSDAALDLFERAARLPGLEAPVAARVAALRGAALLATSRRAEARAALETARKQALRLGDHALEGQVVFHLAVAWQGEGDERRANALCDEALGLLDGGGQPAVLARALLLSGETHHVAGRPDAARAALERGQTVAAALGDGLLRAAIDSALGALSADEGLVGPAASAWGAEVELLRGSAPGPRLVRALLRLADAQRRLGRLDLAVDLLDEADDAARYARHPYSRAEIAVQRAGLMRDLAESAAADALLARGAVALDPDASTALRLAYRRAQVDARLERGDRPAALAACQLGETEASRAGAQALRGWFLGMAGVLTADPAALSAAMDVLTVSGDRRLLARLLLAGARAGGDAELQAAGEREARAAADPLLVLAALHARGDAAAQAEARALARQLLPFVPPSMQGAFLRAPPVVWSGLSGALGLSST
ncbi:MAG: hypothetical protein RL071_1984 [Pseudomonadota bacterium]